MIDHLRGREKALEAFGWTGRSAIAAHVATWRSDAAAHGHAPSPDAGACRKTGCHPPAGRHALTGSFDTRGWCLYNKAADDHRAHAHDGEENPLFGRTPTASPRNSAADRYPSLWGPWSRWELTCGSRFARNNQIHRASAGWAYRIGQADLRDVREADGLFAVVNGCPPDEGVMVELGLAIAWEKPVFLFRDDFRRCTDSEVYPLNLMLFTGLPAVGWEAAWYGSIEEIADPGKALARWLRHDWPPGSASAEADPIEV